MSNDSAKQKAVEIVEKYLKCTFKDYEGTTETFDMAEAKQCALIAVGLIIDCIYNEDFDGHLVDEIGANHFWDEVRSDIEKL